MASITRYFIATFPAHPCAPAGSPPRAILALRSSKTMDYRSGSFGEEGRCARSQKPGLVRAYEVSADTMARLRSEVQARIPAGEHITPSDSWVYQSAIGGVEAAKAAKAA